MAKGLQDIEQAVPKVVAFLKERGVELNPEKGKRWIFRRYFEKGRYGATFYADTKDGRGKKIRLRLFRMPTLPIVRHVKVKGTASPDDPSLREYWETRQAKMGRQRVARGSKWYQVAERQRWKCPDCGNPLFDGQPVDIHHITLVEEGGVDEVENLVWLHEGCHYQRHRRRVKSHLARAG